MSTGTNAELFSAALSGADMSSFDTAPAGAPDIFSDEGQSEAEDLLGQVAETAAKPAEAVVEPAKVEAPVAKADDEPPAWFKAWQASQVKPAEPVAPKVEERPVTPEDALAALVADPKKAIADEAKRIAEEMMAPMREQYRTAIVTASQARAVTEHGKEALSAAEAALEAAVKAGQLDPNKVAEALKNSNDPYGDVVRWHGEQQQRARLEAMAKDPDGFLLSQLQEAVKDPAKRDKFLAAFGQAEPSPAVATQRAGNVTELQPRDTKSGQFLPSLNRGSSAREDDEEPSDPGVVFQTAMRGPRR